MLTKITHSSTNSLEYFDYFKLYNHPLNNPWMHFPRRIPEAFYAIFQAQSNAGDVFLYRNEAGEVIGGFRFIFNKKGPYQHVATLASVCIDPKFKGQGHGKQLLAEALAYIKESHPEISRMELTYEMDNEVAMLGGIYERAGFHKEASFHDWFRSNDELYQKEKHPWYSGEWFCGLLLKPTTEAIPLLFMQQQPQRDVSANYQFVKAENKDISQLIRLYANSLTELAFYSDEEKKTWLNDKINSGHLFVVYNQHNEILAATQVDPQPVGLEQIAVLQNIVTDEKAVAAGAYLLEQIQIFYRAHAGVKRIELVVPAESNLLAALAETQYEYTGTRRERFCDLKGKHLDEHYFEYSLFNLDDAIECCDRRSQAEHRLFMTSKGQFHLPLSFQFLETLKKELVSIKATSESLLTRESEILYQLVRIICTQDCNSIAQRLKEYQIMEEKYTEISKNMHLQKILQVCTQQLKKLESLEKLSTDLAVYKPKPQRNLSQP